MNNDTIHVCVLQIKTCKLVRQVCLDCKKRSIFVCLYYEWYGPSITCLNCGRNWQDGEWMPFMFSRSARQRSINSAKEAYRNYKVTS